MIDINFVVIVVVLIAIVISAVLILWKKKKSDKLKEEPNYHALFAVGIFWFFSGIAVMSICLLLDVLFVIASPLFIMGLMCFVIGLANRDKWELGKSGKKKNKLEEDHLEEIKQLLKDHKSLTQIKKKIQGWKREGYDVEELEKTIKNSFKDQP